MTDSILIELAHCWDIEASKDRSDNVYEDSPAGHTQFGKDIARGEVLKECADTIRSLVSMLGDKAS